MNNDAGHAGDKAAEALVAAAQRVREAQVLGRGGQLLRLFDHLVRCATEGRVPKEAEIAVDAFGRGADFDGAQDASVRVYVHKLRKALADYQAGPGRGDPCHLTLPRGEYRLLLETAAAGVAPAAVITTALHTSLNTTPNTTLNTAAEVDPAEPAPRALPVDAGGLPSGTHPSPRRRWALAAATLAAAGVGVGVGWWLWRPRDPAVEEMRAVRASMLWRPLLDDERPIMVVTGDYMLLGDTEGGVGVRRLVREFDIDSAADLARHEKAGRYKDLGLSYLPVAVAAAMRDVMPLLSLPHKRIRVLPMSQTSADALGLAHVVYLGLLSGMGRLRSAVFAGSGFAVGSSHDELVDTAAGGQTHTAVGAEARAELRDYSFISAFPGPGGNRTVVVAGTRDVGLQQAGRIVGRAEPLLSLQSAVGGAVAFEALYRTTTRSMDALPPPQRLVARPLKGARSWTGGP